MGTRGFTGLVIDGVEKMGYQQFDSYPSGVGVQVLEQLHALVKDMPTLMVKARALQVVDNDVARPTPEQIAGLRQYANLGVSEQSDQDWYCLLRNTHGDLQAILECGYVEDHSRFALDSLFCEYGYLVDLDAGTFQVYRGFQKERPTNGRWAGRPTVEEERTWQAEHNAWCKENGREPWMDAEAEYKAVHLWQEWPLDALPDEVDFLTALGEYDTEDV